MQWTIPKPSLREKIKRSTIFRCVIKPMGLGLIWFIFDFSGLCFIYHEFVPFNPEKSPKRQPSTGVLWLIGIYVALFGIASQRYENRISRIENSANGVYAQLGSKTWKQALARIGNIQNLSLPEKPYLIFTCDKEIGEYLKGKKASESKKIMTIKPEKINTEKIKDNFDCFLTLFRSLFSDQVTDQHTSKFLQDLLVSLKYDLSKTNLRRVNLSRTDLRGADLSESDLDRANLNNANLAEANLYKANLFLTDLSRANLRNVNFFATNLGNANLTSADLEGTVLKLSHFNNSIFDGANLSGASIAGQFIGGNFKGADFSSAKMTVSNFIGTDFKGADFSSVTIYQTLFAGVDLSQVIGLTQDQIDSATVTEDTKLPAGLALNLSERIKSKQSYYNTESGKTGNIKTYQPSVK